MTSIDFIYFFCVRCSPLIWARVEASVCCVWRHVRVVRRDRCAWWCRSQWRQVLWCSALWTGTGEYCSIALKQ
jgi:hypothetical protein